MVGQIASGQKHTKGVWGGADRKETLYDHEAAKEAKKRKRATACLKPPKGGPVLKQNRVSPYFRRVSAAGSEENRVVLVRIDALEKNIAWLKRKISRRKRTAVTPQKELLEALYTERLRDRKPRLV